MSKFTKASIVMMIAFCVLAIFLADQTVSPTEDTVEIPTTAIEIEVEAPIEEPKQIAAPKPVIPRKTSISESAREARARRENERELRSSQLPEGELPETDSVTVRTISED